MCSKTHTNTQSNICAIFQPHEQRQKDEYESRKKKWFRTMIYQVIVIFVYDAHLPDLWNRMDLLHVFVCLFVGWFECVFVRGMDWMARWLRRFFKLHFFFDCCCVLFSYRLSNGIWTYAFIAWCIRSDQIFSCLGNCFGCIDEHKRKLQTTPLIFLNSLENSTIWTLSHSHAIAVLFSDAFLQCLFEILCRCPAPITFVSRR